MWDMLSKGLTRLGSMLGPTRVLSYAIAIMP
jgi:hypothetical protein